MRFYDYYNNTYEYTDNSMYMYSMLLYYSIRNFLDFNLVEYSSIQLNQE
jgi:hypothetical protein